MPSRPPEASLHIAFEVATPSATVGVGRRGLRSRPVIVVASPEDLTTRVGADLGWSDWHTITQVEIDHFAEATGNTAPIHTDPTWAADHSPYGTTIAYGIQVLAMATMLLSDLWELRGVTGGVDLGSNKVRHLAPVLSGGRVRLGARIAGAEPVGGGGVRTTLDLTFAVEGSERPACVAEIVFIYTFG